MKKLTALILTLCLMLLCGCSLVEVREINPTPVPATSADPTAYARIGGAWYANLFGRLIELTLHEDLTCAMKIADDNYRYSGRWQMTDDALTLDIYASGENIAGEMPMGTIPFSVTSDTLTCTIYGAELFSFLREIPASIEVAPVRTDAVLDDFIHVWKTEMICLNGIIPQANGTAISPSEFGADMTVSIGTTSAAVETAAEPDTVYIFPISFADGTLTMTLENMVMTAQLHEDGMMSIRGITPLHNPRSSEDMSFFEYMNMMMHEDETTNSSIFTEDLPLILYMRAEKEDLG